MPYQIFQDGGFYADAANLDGALELAEALLNDGGDPTTFTVEDADGYLVASVTNRRIIGTFVKQAWGGRKGDDACFVEEVEFDATNHVLLMTHEALTQLQDGFESTDELGLAHISWNGPCEVSVTDAICQFFGVDDIRDVTPEALAYARNRAHPQPPEEKTITLSIKLNLRVTPGASVQEFIEDLEYSVTSNTVGVVVCSTELTDAS